MSPKQDARSALGSPTVLAWHSAGWLLLVGMFLPLSRGCDDRVRWPLEFQSPQSFSDWLLSLMIILVFAYAACVACLLTAVALWRSEKLWWYTYWVQLSVTLALTVWSMVINWPSSLSELVKSVFVFGPMLVGLTVWIGRPLYAGERAISWARLQHGWTLSAWLFLQMMCMFSRVLLIGYWWTTAAMIGVVVVTEWTRHRLAHDLWDPTVPVSPVQFSIKQLFFWMTFFPIVIGYYQAIQPLCDWILGVD